MLSNIHQTIAEVRELRARTIEGERFRGYSGIARALGSPLVFLAALYISSQSHVADISFHFFTWGIVCAIAFALNYGAVALWFLSIAPSERDPLRLRPAIDAIPPFFAGGVLTFAAYRLDTTSMLPGIWMCLFGLMNASARRILPPAIWHLGWYYIICGLWALLLWDNPDFTNPWPMAVVFGIGELTGGYLFARNRRPHPLNEQEETL